MKPVVLRILVGGVGLCIAAAAYYIAAEKVVVVECNITEVIPGNDGVCAVAHGVVEGRDAEILLEVGSRCMTADDLRELNGRCHERHARVYLGPPSDHIGAVVVVGFLSAICILCSVFGSACRAKETRERQDADDEAQMG